LAQSGTPSQLLWIGSSDGVERRAAAAAGIDYVAIPTGKLRRYLTLATPRDLVRLPRGLLAARAALVGFRPNVVFSTGGFVSVPAVLAARWLSIPCLTHEQTVTVGLANRINARFADRIALSYRASSAWLPRHPLLEPDTVADRPDTAPGEPLLSPTTQPVEARPRPWSRRWWSRAPLVVTGNPIRPELLHGQPGAAQTFFQLPAALPVVYLTGGARGSHALNTVVGDVLPDLLAVCSLVHQTGPTENNGDLPRLEAIAAALPGELRTRYRPVAYIGSELADLLALASLVVGRSGAGTIAELAALGKPSVLVPLPGASADEQERNARMLADAGAALALPEAALTPGRLVQSITDLLGHPERLTAMGAAARQFAVPDAATRLVDHLLALARPMA
jgi:UDP-N-acetylglucosamine--N-acetylmuramyl-(pentapeptide) pyrophosphoryl-undecaprenol N-acetylglucosamine transferase